MAVVVDVTFDARADVTVRRLWASLDAHGFDVSSQIESGPHLTMFLATDGDPEAVGARLASSDFGRFPPIGFGSVGYFRSPGQVLYLAATPTIALLDLQSRIWKTATTLAPTQSPYYQPGTWTPHCTLALGVATADLGRAVEALAGLPTLFETRIERLRAHAWEDDTVWLSPPEPAEPTIDITSTNSESGHRVSS